MEFNGGHRKEGPKSIPQIKKLSIEEYKARAIAKSHDDKKSTPNRVRKSSSLSEREIQRALKEKEEVIPGFQDDLSSNETNADTLNEKIFMAATKSQEYKEKKTKSIEEPEILTLSSDEDEPIEDSTKLDGRLCLKEPVITKNMKFPSYLDAVCQNDESPSISVSLACRAIRIGSHKFVPIGNVSFCRKSVTFTAPSVGNSQQIDIHIPLECVIKILHHFEPGLTSIFVYLTPPFAIHLRQKLEMKEIEGVYFDPCSTDESKKRLIIFIDKISSILIKHFSQLYNNRSSVVNATLLEHLTKDEVNTILINSSPAEIHSLLKTSMAPMRSSCKTLLVYPPPPSKGRITINVEDYECLAEEQFLNDVIIDFYLKWLHMEKLPGIYRSQTHVFSTFFYKRLTAKPKKGRRNDPHETDIVLTPAQKRHGRVKSWTKGVNIFEKDFIMIPINERSHWFLAVICYPGAEVSGPAGCGTQEESPSTPTRRTTRVRSKTQKHLELDLEWSDRDEAESDEELNGVDEFRDGKFSQLKPEKELSCSVKHSCILLFDSLSGSNRSRIVSTLREYLSVEYQERKGTAKKFTKENMEGFLPMVPQQMNYSDCGVYTLQFAESFFDNPIKNYKLPIQSLEEWFSQEVVLGKRESIANLISSLVKQANNPNRHPIPNIKFPSKKKSIQTDGELDDQEQRESRPVKRKATDEELQSNDFNPINLPAMKCAGKKISVNLSSKTIASTMDMKNELDKYCMPFNISQSLELIKNSYLDSADSPPDSKATLDEDIYGDLDTTDSCSKTDSQDFDIKSPDKVMGCAKRPKLSSPENDGNSSSDVETNKIVSQDSR